jgi:ABC-type uncharacterized transport system involved in gliding motility auxiliary subunit
MAKMDWIKTRQTRYTAYASVYILIVLAVLGVANFLAQRHNYSFDSTSNKRFSLSDQTIKIVRDLKTDVKISYFDRTGAFATARDLLDRYDNLSTKLSVEYIDPEKKPQIARAAGLRNLGTVFVEANGKKEEAKSTSEEEITGALIRALKGGQRSVCVLTGSGEHSIEETGRLGYSGLKELLERNNYKARALSLLGNADAAAANPEAKQSAPKEFKPEVPSDCTVLVVGGPKYDYLEPTVNAIRTFVENGGRALIMLDPPLQSKGEETGENAALVKVLADWGATLNKDLVLDLSPVGQLFGLSAVVPLVTSYEYHAIVREMKEVATAFPMTRTVEVKSGDKTTVDKLFSTTANSYATTNMNISGEIQIDPKKDRKGPLTLAAAGTYRTGKENVQGRFVVVGGSGWVANNILRFNGNRDLAMNMFNWLTSDEDLISIRPKEPENRPLSLSRAQMNRVFYFSLLFLPLAVIGAGVGVWWRRR